MKKYKIEVEEILQRVIEVEAESFEEALEIIEKKYKKEKIVLDWEDFVDVSFRKFE